MTDDLKRLRTLRAIHPAGGPTDRGLAWAAERIDHLTAEKAEAERQAIVVVAQMQVLHDEVVHLREREATLTAERDALRLLLAGDVSWALGWLAAEAEMWAPGHERRVLDIRARVRAAVGGGE